MEETRIRYESADDYITQGAIIRSRVRWFEKGEKSNSYFLRLENQNNSSSCIRKLKLDDGRVTTDSAEILVQLKSFYSDLYQDHGCNSDGDGAARFLYNPSIPKLDKDEKKNVKEDLHTMNVIARFSLFKLGKRLGMTVSQQGSIRRSGHSWVIL